MKLFTIIIALLPFFVCPERTDAVTVDLELRPVTVSASVGDTIEIELWAIPSEEGVEINSAQTILIWDSLSIELLGCTNPGIPRWNSLFRVGDSFGLNEANPPADGSALWIGEASLGRTVLLDVEGTVLTIFQFEAIADSISEVNLLLTIQLPDRPMARTKVNVGTYNRIGSVGPPVVVTVGEQSCGNMDANDDGLIDLADFAEFQLCFDAGAGTASAECLAVFDGDCDDDVDLDDYAIFQEAITGPVEPEED